MGTTNTLDLNNRVTELEKAVSGGDSNQANKADIATEFNTTTAYTAGCFVYYGGKLYQFNADHAAGAWDPTDVVEANVTDQVVSNKSAIDGLAESYPANKVMMSDGVTSVEDRLDSMSVNIVDNNYVDISGYDATNYYTCPTDGYVKLVADGAMGNRTALYIIGVSVAMAMARVCVDNTSMMESIYVRKGTKIYATRSESQYSGAYFFKLT